MFKGKLDFGGDFLADLFKAKMPPLIGVDISSSSVKMVELAEAGKGRLRLERYAIEPLPKDAVVDGNIMNLEAVGESMRRGWKRMGTRLKNLTERIARVTANARRMTVIGLVKKTKGPPRERDCRSEISTMSPRIKPTSNGA